MTTQFRPLPALTPADEWVVLVDDTNTPIGATLKRLVHTDNTRLHRGFSCFIFDDVGRFLLTQRASIKLTFPGMWTNSCCGHPAPGEETRDAVRRRARQELGLRLWDLRLVLPGFRYQAEMNGLVENEVCPVFVARTFDVPRHAPAEVAAHQWVYWEDVVDRAVAEPRTLSPWCVEQIMLLVGRPEIDSYTSAKHRQ